MSQKAAIVEVADGKKPEVVQVEESKEEVKVQMIDTTKKQDLNPEESKADVNVSNADGEPVDDGDGDNYLNMALNLTKLQDMVKMPRDQAVKNNKELAQKEKIIMPTTFTNRETYFTKLKELIETEARIDEL